MHSYLFKKIIIFTSQFPFIIDVFLEPQASLLKVSFASFFVYTGII